MTLRARLLALPGTSVPDLGRLFLAVQLTLSAVAITVGVSRFQELRDTCAGHPDVAARLLLAAFSALLIPLLTLLFAIRSRAASRAPVSERPFLSRLLMDPSGRLGLRVLGVLTSLALLAPLLVAFEPQSLSQPPQFEASLLHPLGMDLVGHDQLSRLLHGAGPSLLVAFLTALISTSLGTLVGTIAGYFGGWIDGLLMWLVDLLLSLPRLLVLLVCLGLTGVPDRLRLLLIALLLGLTGWMEVARLVRAQVEALRGQDWVLAARGLGLGNARILGVHILPSVLATVAVNAALAAGATVLMESSLSFLGFGTSAEAPSWGLLSQEGRALHLQGWRFMAAPGLAIVVLVLSFNMVAEGLRRSLDPRSESSRGSP